MILTVSEKFKRFLWHLHVKKLKKEFFFQMYKNLLPSHDLKHILAVTRVFPFSSESFLKDKIFSFIYFFTRKNLFFQVHIHLNWDKSLAAAAAAVDIWMCLVKWLINHSTIFFSTTIPTQFIHNVDAFHSQLYVYRNFQLIHSSSSVLKSLHFFFLSLNRSCNREKLYNCRRSYVRQQSISSLTIKKFIKREKFN